MKEIKIQNMTTIIGGASISGSMINALIKGVSTILELGRSLGTALYMLINKKRC